MPGLALKLGPRERVLINGVLVENGPRRAQLVIKSDRAAILRMREAISDSDVIGPASQAYYTAQQAVAGTLTLEEAMQELLPNLTRMALPETETLLEEARRTEHPSQYYRLMRRLRPLVEDERAESGLEPMSQSQRRDDLTDPQEDPCISRNAR